MAPNPSWNPEEHESVVNAWAEVADEITIQIWGGDWCDDCVEQLPDFSATLAAAGISEDQIQQYPVEKLDDGSKAGPKVSEYGIEWIPTVVVERDGEEIARFVEKEDRPIAVHLADQFAYITSGT